MASPYDQFISSLDAQEREAFSRLSPADQAAVMARYVGTPNMPQVDTKAYPQTQSPIASVAPTVAGAAVKEVMGSGGAASVSDVVTGIGPVASGDVYGAAITPSGWDLGGFGAEGNYLGPIAGAVGLYDIYANERSGVRGAAQGAASGAAIGSYFGPWGTGIGAVIGGTYGAFGNAHESTEDFKNRKANDLIEAGFKPQDVQSNFYDANADDEMWKRIKGTAMRNPLMIADSYGLKDTFGPGYMTNMNEFERFAAAQYAIDNNLVGGKKGIIDITDKQALRDGYRAYVENQNLQNRYNAFKQWESENAPKGANPMTYFGYTEEDAQKEAQGRYKVDQSQLAQEWKGPDTEIFFEEKPMANQPASSFEEREKRRRRPKPTIPTYSNVAISDLLPEYGGESEQNATSSFLPQSNRKSISTTIADILRR